MKVTTEDLQRYVGGQLEIQNEAERYIYRGEIAAVVIEEGDSSNLKVTFSWFAKGEEYPLPTRWISDPRLDYTMSMMLIDFSDIGEGRLCYREVFPRGELGVFFPPDGSKVDPFKVEGLQLTSN